MVHVRPAWGCEGGCDPLSKKQPCPGGGTSRQDQSKQSADAGLEGKSELIARGCNSHVDEGTVQAESKERGP